MKRGFSLIELLVVIAIISIIAALLFAVLYQQREKGRQAACQSNMHQLRLSLQMYMDDNDGYFPDSERFSDWGILHPELPTCPSVGVRRDIEKQIRNRAGVVRGIPGYPINAQLLDPKRHENAVLFAASTVVFCEQDAIGDLKYGPRGFVCGPDPAHGSIPYPYNQVRSWKRHHGGCNYVFYDGHIKWLTEKQVRYCWDGNDGMTPSFALSSNGLSEP